MPVKTVKLPVVEIFGPTIQGEGIDQGIPCYFVRFGGCDFKCDWCDTPHAVLPHNVRHARQMDEEEIAEELDSLIAGPHWVVFSGGNPVLHGLSPLIKRLHEDGYKISVETQGSKDKFWLYDVDRLCLSPKPPSSGMRFDQGTLRKIIRKSHPDRTFLKVVVFDHNDYLFAREIHQEYPDIPFFLSTGNDAGKTVGNPGREDTRTESQVKLDLMHKTRDLVNRAMVDPVMHDVRTQSQFHVLLWGNKLGV